MRPGVYVTETSLPTPVPESSSSLAAGAMLAQLPSGLTGPTLVTSWFQFTRLFGPMRRDYPATFAANAFFRSGGRELYVTRVIRENAERASVDLVASDGESAYLTFEAKSPGAYGNALRVRLTPTPAGRHNVEIIQEFGLANEESDDLVVETYRNVDLSQGNTEIVDILAVRSRYVRAIWPVTADELELPTTIAPLPLAGGSDGTTASDLNWEDSVAALGSLDRQLVLFSPGQTDEDILSLMIQYAANNGGFVVVDTEPNITPAAAVTYAETVADTATFAGSAQTGTYAAVYYPHVWVADPTSRSRDAIVKVAPSGSVAGMILSTDVSVGPFKAPAGIGATISGAVALERELSSEELDNLNNDSVPVNALRTLPGLGVVAMGARTLDQSTSNRYVNIRRSMSFLNREMRQRSAFALFERNDSTLWDRLYTTLSTYLTAYWQAGGLRGATPEQAFYVKVDAENNPPSDIQNGIVNIEVGLAVQFPAEFVKIRLSQQTLS